MNAMAGRLVAAVGAALAIIGIFLDYVPGQSYWSLDGTLAAVGLAGGILAALLVAAGFAGQARDEWLFAIGAVLVGYWGFYPALTAFGDWKHTRAGMWLAFAGGILIALGAAASLLRAGVVRSTPSGTTLPAIAAGIGIVLVVPGIFLDAVQGTSYWNASGHSLGIVMLILAIAAGLVWAATAFAGTQTRGLDVGLTLVLLGLVAFNPVGAAFGDFGVLDSGAWLALAGGILAAGGTWAARGAELPHTAAAAA